MKMMIIDDDVQIREGIRDGIDWESMGISKVRSYGDGCEALADVEEFMPEIVLADIRMPEMDGLEFLKRIKQKNERVKVILISAYSDFSYCQKAITLGASGYELKPLKVGKLIQTIQETIELIQKENKGKEIYEKYAASYREKMLREVLGGQMTDRNVIMDVLRTGAGLNEVKNLICMVLDVDDVADGKRLQDGKLLEFLKKTITDEQAVLEYDGKILVLSKVKNSTLYVMNIQNLLKNVYYQATSYAREQKFTISAGISEMKAVEQISLACQSAMGALQYRFLTGPESCKIFDYEKKQQQESISLPPEYRKAIERHDWSELGHVVDEMEAQIRQKNITDADQIRVLVKRGIEQLGVYLKTEPEGQKREFVYLSDLMSEWKNQCAQMCEKWEEEQNLFYSSNVKKAISYIKSHYAEDILVEQVAEEIGKTPNYFSSIFKAEVGIPFREYLNRLRVEKARKMLEETDMLIYAIAQQVGYKDYTYFSQIFKKVTGISPTAVRGTKLDKL